MPSNTRASPSVGWVTRRVLRSAMACGRCPPVAQVRACSISSIASARPQTRTASSMTLPAGHLLMAPISDDGRRTLSRIGARRGSTYPPDLSKDPGDEPWCREEPGTVKRSSDADGLSLDSAVKELRTIFIEGTNQRIEAMERTL